MNYEDRVTSKRKNVKLNKLFSYIIFIFYVFVMIVLLINTFMMRDRSTVICKKKNSGKVIAF